MTPPEVKILEAIPGAGDIGTVQLLKDTAQLTLETGKLAKDIVEQIIALMYVGGSEAKQTVEKLTGYLDRLFTKLGHHDYPPPPSEEPYASRALQWEKNNKYAFYRYCEHYYLGKSRDSDGKLEQAKKALEALKEKEKEIYGKVDSEDEKIDSFLEEKEDLDSLKDDSYEPVTLGTRVVRRGPTITENDFYKAKIGKVEENIIAAEDRKGEAEEELKKLPTKLDNDFGISKNYTKSADVSIAQAIKDVQREVDLQTDEHNKFNTRYEDAKYWREHTENEVKKTLKAASEQERAYNIAAAKELKNPQLKSTYETEGQKQRGKRLVATTTEEELGALKDAVDSDYNGTSAKLPVVPPVVTPVVPSPEPAAEENAPVQVKDSVEKPKTIDKAEFLAKSGRAKELNNLVASLNSGLSSVLQVDIRSMHIYYSENHEKHVIEFNINNKDGEPVGMIDQWLYKKDIDPENPYKDVCIYRGVGKNRKKLKDEKYPTLKDKLSALNEEE